MTRETARSRSSTSPSSSSRTNRLSLSSKRKQHKHPWHAHDTRNSWATSTFNESSGAPSNPESCSPPKSAPSNPIFCDSSLSQNSSYENCRRDPENLFGIPLYPDNLSLSRLASQSAAKEEIPDAQKLSFQGSEKLLFSTNVNDPWKIPDSFSDLVESSFPAQALEAAALTQEVDDTAFSSYFTSSISGLNGPSSDVVPALVAINEGTSRSSSTLQFRLSQNTTRVISCSPRNQGRGNYEKPKTRAQQKKLRHLAYRTRSKQALIEGAKGGDKKKTKRSDVSPTLDSLEQTRQGKNGKGLQKKDQKGSKKGKFSEPAAKHHQGQRKEKRKLFGGEGKTGQNGQMGAQVTPQTTNHLSRQKEKSHKKSGADRAKNLHGGAVNPEHPPQQPRPRQTERSPAPADATECTYRSQRFAS